MLNTDANIEDADGFYEALLLVHEDQSDAESAAINARLILLLANHIGDREVLDKALEYAALDEDSSHN